ncbi:MAG TPA: ABC transporter permease [Kiloniellales bacterium]|jgi:spermidine/putrescine transport system permease protein
MSAQRIAEVFTRTYIGIFFLYLFLPLIVMGTATFNDSRFPTITPWRGTTLKWFSALAADNQMWNALWTSFAVGVGVILVAVPIGVAAALFLSDLQTRAKTFIYGVMVSPLLTPGVIIGISTLIFWRPYGVTGGMLLMILAQSSFIAAYVMLMVMARMQRFDRTLEEAALDLGATHLQAFRKVTLPFLRPSILAGCLIAFLQSFENYNTTIFVRGFDTTLTVYIASKVRTGVTPAVNALGLILIGVTILAAIAYEIRRRSEAAAAAAEADRARAADDATLTAAA